MSIRINSVSIAIISSTVINRGAIMRMVFVRLDEKNFSIFPGLSRGCGDKRMIELLENMLRYYYTVQNQPLAGHSIGFYLQNDQSAPEYIKKVIHFAKKEGYIFWDIFDFYGETFSYDAKKEVFFETRRKGKTLKEALEAMKGV